ncbi:MAG: response regulator [Gammaproteobacteria bacterium]|nr:response regulator [Gammaproteobacteria bacterium]
MKNPEARRILVVEDETMIAMLLEDMLAALDCTVVGPFATVATALEALQREPPRAALLDINLGGHEVYPVAEALAGRNIPFAFVTGYDDAGVDAAWRERPLLEKPFRREDLEQVASVLFDTV